MGVVVRCPSMATHIRTFKCRILSFSVALSDYSGGSWSKKANMSTATCLVAANLITSGTIQRSTRPQTTLFLLICSIKVAPNGNKSHQELLFIAK